MGILDSIKGLFTSGQETLEKTKNIANQVVENSTGVINSITDTVSEAGSELVDHGKEFVEKSVETLSEAKDTVLEKGTEVINSAKETIANATGAEDASQDVTSEEDKA